MTDTTPAGRAVALAREWIGTPYRHQASVPHVAFDCLGLIRALWRTLEGDEPEPVPPYASSWAETTGRDRMGDLLRAHFLVREPSDHPEAGDVVAFRMRAGAPAKHCGLATGADTFVHAYQGIGVVESRFDRFWSSRIALRAAFPSARDVS